MKARGPTERQRYLLDYIRQGSVKVSVWPTFQIWSIVRAHLFYRHGSQYNPSEREGKRLIERGWVELVLDPHHHTTNSETGERFPHYHAKLTAAGAALLTNPLPSKRE